MCIKQILIRKTYFYAFFEFPRVLGDEFSHLKNLSVCHCGLSDLDGVNYAPNVVNIVAVKYNYV